MFLVNFCLFNFCYSLGIGYDSPETLRIEYRIIYILIENFLLMEV